jgi:hypothetical protein
VSLYLLAKALYKRAFTPFGFLFLAPQSGEEEDFLSGWGQIAWPIRAARGGNSIFAAFEIVSGRFKMHISPVNVDFHIHFAKSLNEFWAAPPRS